MDYDIYHDESKEEAFWHIFLFVPHFSKEKVLTYLKEAKKNSKLNLQDFSFKNLSSKNSIECTKNWLSILSSALQQKDKNQLEPFLTGRDLEFCHTQKRRIPNHKVFDEAPKFKIAIFHQKNNHNDMNGHNDTLSKIETTFRMGLQGASHFLFRNENKLNIKNIVLDREEHYKIVDRRDFNKEKIISKLENNFRNYCSFDANFSLSGENISEEDQFFLDLADLFLGAFRLGILKPKFSSCSKREKEKFVLCKAINPLIERVNQGGARMKNSRFENFGTFSSAYIENDEWKFGNLNENFLNPPKEKLASLFNL